jgi:PAS domain S-box-containing protein
MPSRKRARPQSAIRHLQRALAALKTQAPPESVVRGQAEILIAYLRDVPVAILIANNHARYVDVNRAAMKLTGFTRRELLHMGLSDLTPAPRRTVGTKLWRDFLTRGRMTGRYDLRRKNGSTVRVQYLAVANILPGVHVSALSPVDQKRRPAKPRG